MGRLFSNIVLPRLDCLKDLLRSRLRDVRRITRIISITAAPAATASLMVTQSGQVRRLPNIFCTMALLARNIVINTLNTSRMLAHSGCGLSPMNCSSLRQSSSSVEKNGSRQPLKTCATRMTYVLSAVTHTDQIK